MKTRFPPIKPYAQHTVEVGSHRLYVEESGEPTGLPVLFVHGGPGAGCSPDDRCYFNPERYRIILFDQRGCGRSQPFGSLEDNTTSDLIEDMEAIRRYLHISKWCLFGGSWGSTLSVLYTQRYPLNVRGLILRGIFLGDTKEIDWLYKEGANHIFPDFWQDFVASIHEEERDDLIGAYKKRLQGDNDLARMDAAKHWARWEAQCATLHPSLAVCKRFTEPHTAMSLALIETHYFSHRCFLEPNQILRDAYKLEGIPGILVHGRYDMVCPLSSAYTLNAAWPGSELNVIREAGHSASEPGILDALINASESMVRRCLK